MYPAPLEEVKVRAMENARNAATHQPTASVRGKSSGGSGGVKMREAAGGRQNASIRNLAGSNAKPSGRRDRGGANMAVSARDTKERGTVQDTL